MSGACDTFKMRSQTDSFGMRECKPSFDMGKNCIPGPSGPPGKFDPSEYRKVMPHDTATGVPAVFSDGGDGVPVNSLTANIVPVQNLRGYGAAWIGGAGKNKLPNIATSGTSYGITRTLNDDGSLTLDGTATSTFNIQVAYISTNDWFDKLPDGDYILTGCPTGGSGSKYRIVGNINNGGRFATDTGSSASFTKGAADTQMSVYVRINSGTVIDNLTFYPMIRAASESDDSYVPYENICPISGRTGLEVFVAASHDVASAAVYPVAWESEAGEIFAGILNATTGKLTATHKLIELSAATEWLVSSSVSGRYLLNNDDSAGIVKSQTNFFCSHFKPSASSSKLGTVYVSTGPNVVFNTPFATKAAWQTYCGEQAAAGTPIVCVCEIDAPQEYQLEAVTGIVSLLGQNYVWSDAGSVTVEYLADPTLYIAKKIAAAVAAMS